MDLLAKRSHVTPLSCQFCMGFKVPPVLCLDPFVQKTGFPCWAVPIRFIEAHALKKPKKKASLEELLTYEQMRKQYNLSSIFVKELKNLRTTLNHEGVNKKLLIVGDGSFCNRICLREPIDDVELIVRCRKDLKLCHPYQGPKKKVYDEVKFTPEEIRQDQNHPWHQGTFFYGGDWRPLRYKVVNNVLWQSGTKTRPLRLLILAPLTYVRGGKR